MAACLSASLHAPRMITSAHALAVLPGAAASSGWAVAASLASSCTGTHEMAAQKAGCSSAAVGA